MYTSIRGTKVLGKIKEKGIENDSKKEGEIISNGKGWNFVYCDKKFKLILPIQ